MFDPWSLGTGTYPQGERDDAVMEEDGAERSNEALEE